MVKNPPANVGDSVDVGSIPELGRSPGRGNGNLFQYSCLEKSHGQRSQTWLSTRAHLVIPDFKAVIYIYSTYKYLVRYIYLKYLFPLSSLHLQILSVLFFFFFFFISFGHTMWHVGSWFPNKGLNQSPAVEAWKLNHWTADKVLSYFLFMKRSS